MSDPNNKIPAPEDQARKSEMGDIDWSLYGRAAEAIRSQVAQYGTDEVAPIPEDEPIEEPVLRQEELHGPREKAAGMGATIHIERTNVPSEAYADQSSDRLSQAREYYARTSRSVAPPPQPPVTPPKEPGEQHQERPRKKRVQSTGVTVLVAILYAVSVLSIAFVTATLGWRWAGDLLALNKQAASASVTIKSGESIHEVAEKLEDYGLIEYPVLFEVFASFTNKADKITSGTYELNTNMDYSALLNNMSVSSSAREEVEITIPEGYTVKEIFQLLDSMGACTVEELEESAMNDEFSYSFLDGLERDDPYWMEGYLFPDTYKLYKDGDAKVALSKMLYNYSVKFDSEMKTRAERLGYTQHEIMIVASIIEKETDGTDQKAVASVIYNRLQTSGETLGKLQMDSTIQYSLEERKEHLTDADLEVDSPYNT
ncbi:MAG: endolytic transglycosylase MltG, partial [Oscillospiraceae bacterium]|nr:endolytic transglycosylase MltG [Oscillospiraceae bacterium]